MIYVDFYHIAPNRSAVGNWGQQRQLVAPVSVYVSGRQANGAGYRIRTYIFSVYLREIKFAVAVALDLVYFQPVVIINTLRTSEEIDSGLRLAVPVKIPERHTVTDHIKKFRANAYSRTAAVDIVVFGGFRRAVCTFFIERLAVDEQQTRVDLAVARRGAE